MQSAAFDMSERSRSLAELIVVCGAEESVGPQVGGLAGVLLARGVCACVVGRASFLRSEMSGCNDWCGQIKRHHSGGS